MAEGRNSPPGDAATPPPPPASSESTEWVHAVVDYAALIAQIEAEWGDSELPAEGKLNVIEEAIQAMASRSDALERGVAEAVASSSPEEEAVATAVDWSRAIELLYDDVLHLFQIGDSDGALVSLERLLSIAPNDDGIREFIELNEEKLLKVYADSLGSFTDPLKRNRFAEPMAPAHGENVLLSEVLEAVDGEASVEDLFERLERPRLMVCAGVSLLRRARIIDSGSWRVHV